jgi:hypothetical protein
MNSQKRQELESKLEGKVNIWMDFREFEFGEEKTKFLTVKDLSDRELFDLNFCLNLGQEFGSLTKEDRNELVLNLDFDLK